MSRFVLFMALIATLIADAGTARAHTRDRVFSTWTVDGTQVTATVRLPGFLAARYAAGPGGGSGNALAGHFIRTLYVSIDSRKCNPVKAPAARMTPDGMFIAELAWRCGASASAHSARLTLKADSLFERFPNHVHFVRLRLPGGRMDEGVLVYGDRQHALDIGGQSPPVTRSVTGVITGYTGLGVTHILAGVDHLAFILALMMAAQGLRTLLFLVTGFTLGHSLTLALAATGAASPVASVIEALIGFTIVIAAIEGAARVSGRAPPVAAVALPLAALALAAALFGSALPAVTWAGLVLFTVMYLALMGHMESRRWAVALAAAFGLVHGFGFAGVLQEIGLPEARLLPALLGFNLGVELGQLVVVALALVLAAAAARLTPAATRPWAAQGLAAALCGLGTFWFVSRAFAG